MAHASWTHTFALLYFQAIPRWECFLLLFHFLVPYNLQSAEATFYWEIYGPKTLKVKVKLLLTSDKDLKFLHLHETKEQQNDPHYSWPWV